MDLMFVFRYMPYTGCGNRDVMQLVTSGGRLEPPNNCPGPLYGIMMQCWHPNPEERPNFTTILERLGYCSQVRSTTNTWPFKESSVLKKSGTLLLSLVVLFLLPFSNLLLAEI